MGYDTVEHNCLSCGRKFHGRFCNHCGEKLIENNERTIKYFLGRVFNALTFIDSKFLQTLWTISVRPGHISKDFILGRRRPHFNLISLFFALNLIYFLFPKFETFNTSFKSQMQFQKYSGIVRDLVGQKVKEEKMTVEEFGDRFNRKSHELAKLLLIIFVFLISLALFTVYFSRSRYYADYLTLAFELVSFNLFYNTILLWVLQAAIVKISSSFGMNAEQYMNDETISLIAVSTNLYFMYRAGIIFFGSRPVWSFLRSALMIPAFIACLLAYRFILFLVTYLAI